MVLDRAVTEHQAPHMTSELAKAFQHATRCEIGDRLFLEVRIGTCSKTGDDAFTSVRTLLLLCFWGSSHGNLTNIGLCTSFMKSCFLFTVSPVLTPSFCS